MNSDTDLSDEDNFIPRNASFGHLSLNDFDPFDVSLTRVREINGGHGYGNSETINLQDDGNQNVDGFGNKNGDGYNFRMNDASFGDLSLTKNFDPLNFSLSNLSQGGEGENR